uniref:Retrovirus-related Pol polyprotein from transposon TNT 1-94 n=1 Tax=Cajanus cajan TaxID=3821 RepID=A0A151TML5_CAJCA|nr:Retrovirus-related Pol polyprotein from transposon TNT 1-94 [Cajanus cajan]
MWHNRLGHPNSHVLSTLLKSGSLGNKDFSVPFDCTTCKLGKSKVLPFPNNASRATHCFDIIHSDVWGISPVVSHACYKYFVTFIDDYSRFTWIYFLRSKVEVFSVFQRFFALLETQFSAHINILRSDSGGEYMSHEFQSFLQNQGIISQRSCPSTSQQNGVAKRKNCHLLDVVRTFCLNHLFLLAFGQPDSTPLHADNTSAIQIAANPVFHQRTKHIEVDCHYIREALTSKVIFLPYISTNLQVANIFTKTMTRQRHQFLVGKLLLVDLPASI